MWKDYLHFNRREQNGILVLAVLILIGIGAYAFMPNMVEFKKHDFTAQIAQVDSFYEALKQDSIKKAKAAEILPPQKFRVDTVSPQWLTKHSMPHSIAKSLTHYRDKGGKITTAEKFRSIYGMNDSILKAWESFIVYQVAQVSSVSFAQTSNKTEAFKQKEPEFKIEINSADTAELVVIRGIGPSFAERIVKYRNVLGGYHNINQVAEVYGMDSSRFVMISPYLTIKPVELRKLKINQASLKQMKYHPYLDFYQAKAIYEYRKAGNQIKSWENLISIENLDTAGSRYLPPYLDYSTRE